MKIERFYVQLGQRLRDARNDIGCSQETVAHLLSPRLTRASIANIENGRQRTMAHHITQLSDILGVSLSWLMQGVP